MWLTLYFIGPWSISFSAKYSPFLWQFVHDITSDPFPLVFLWTDTSRSRPTVGLMILLWPACSGPLPSLGWSGFLLPYWLADLFVVKSICICQLQQLAFPCLLWYHRLHRFLFYSARLRIRLLWWLLDCTSCQGRSFFCPLPHVWKGIILHFLPLHSFVNPFFLSSNGNLFLFVMGGRELT